MKNKKIYSVITINESGDINNVASFKNEKKAWEYLTEEYNCIKQKLIDDGHSIGHEEKNVVYYFIQYGYASYFCGQVIENSLS